MARDPGKNLVMLIEDERIVLAPPGADTPVSIDLPGRWSDLEAEAIGRLLRDHLGKACPTAGRVLVGVPASWVLTQRLNVPSTDPAMIASAVRLRVNRDYATDAEDLVSDYTISRSDSGSEVLIGVTMRSRLDCLGQALQHAGLKPAAIHITTQAFSDPKQGDASYLRIQSSSAELIRIQHGYVDDLRTLCDGLDATDPETSARSVVSTLMNDPRLSSASGKMILVSDPEQGSICEAIEARLASAGGADQTETVHESAVEVLKRRASACDLLDLHRCRASHEPSGRWTPRRKLGAYAAAAALLIVIGVGGMWWSREYRLSSLQAQALSMQPEAEALGLVKQKLDDTGAWFDKRVDILSCLHELTQCVPSDSGLRLTELRMNADHGGSLQGRSGSRGAMLRYLDAMQASDRLADVELRDSAEAVNGKREVRFEIVFRVTNGRRGS